MAYLVLILALAVTCFAGVQFYYMMFLQAVNRQQRRRIAELERALIALQQAPPAQLPAPPEADETDEVWAEMIDDGTG